MELVGLSAMICRRGWRSEDGDIGGEIGFRRKEDGRIKID